MAFRLKRVYEPPAVEDGCRILVDRLWPRGLSKQAARIDYWLKDVAPSAELRTWFGHDPLKWAEFKARYFRELDGRSDAVAELMQLARADRATLLFAARDRELNNAAALKEYVESRPRAKARAAGSG